MMAPSSIAIYTHWEVLRSFLLLIGTIFGICLGTLVVHSIQFNTWEENFSKKGLKRHAIDFINYCFLFAIAGTVAAIVKSNHFPPDKK